MQALTQRSCDIQSKRTWELYKFLVRVGVCGVAFAITYYFNEFGIHTASRRDQHVKVVVCLNLVHSPADDFKPLLCFAGTIFI